MFRKHGTGSSGSCYLSVHSVETKHQKRGAMPSETHCLPIRSVTPERRKHLTVSPSLLRLYTARLPPSGSNLAVYRPFTACKKRRLFSSRLSKPQSLRRHRQTRNPPEAEGLPRRVDLFYVSGASDKYVLRPRAAQNLWHPAPACGCDGAFPIAGR